MIRLIDMEKAFDRIRHPIHEKKNPEQIRQKEDMPTR